MLINNIYFDIEFKKSDIRIGLNKEDYWLDTIITYDKNKLHDYLFSYKEIKELYDTLNSYVSSGNMEYKVIRFIKNYLVIYLNNGCCKLKIINGIDGRSGYDIKLNNKEIKEFIKMVDID